MVHAVVAVLLLTAPTPELIESRSRGQPAPTSNAQAAPPAPDQRHNIQASVEAVVDRRMPELLEYARAGRLSLKRGLLNLGGYQPPVADGVKAPPLRLFSSVGAGQSLNDDPITGHSHFWP
jgi:hypothetical protein